MTFNTCCYYVMYHKSFNLPDRVSNGLKNIQFLDWLQFYLHYSGMRALTKQRKTVTAKQNGKGLQGFAAAACFLRSCLESITYSAKTLSLHIVNEYEPPIFFLFA